MASAIGKVATKERARFPAQNGQCGQATAADHAQRTRFSATRNIDLIGDAADRERIWKRLNFMGEYLLGRDPTCKLRDDSRMAWLWARATGHPEPDPRSDDHRQMVVAADRILSTHWVYANTDYRYVSEKVVDAVAADLMEAGLSRRQAYVLGVRHMIPCIKLFYTQHDAVPPAEYTAATENGTGGETAPSLPPAEGSEAPDPLAPDDGHRHGRLSQG